MDVDVEVNEFVIMLPETLKRKIEKLALTLSSMDIEAKTRILSAAINSPVFVVSFIAPV